MEELASCAELAVTKFMEGFADLSLEVCGEMLLALQLVLSVGEGALGFELALAGHLPVSTDLGLELHLVLLHEAQSLLFCLKVLLWLLEALVLRILSRNGAFGLFGALNFLFLDFLFVSDERLYLDVLRGKLRDILQLLGLLGMSVVRLKPSLVGME